MGRDRARLRDRLAELDGRRVVVRTVGGEYLRGRLEATIDPGYWVVVDDGASVGLVLDEIESVEPE